MSLSAVEMHLLGWFRVQRRMDTGLMWGVVREPNRCP